MKKVLIVINGYGLADGIKHQVARLTEEFSKRNIAVDVKKNNDVLTYLKDGKTVITIGKYDFVMYLDKDRYVAGLLEKAGYRLFNSIDSIVKCDDKMLTHLCLADQGIKMPTSISSTLCYTDNGNREYLEKVEDLLGFPMIVKENYGSLGKQVYLANNKEELLEIENKLIHVPHIFQKFISSSKGKDFRVIVIGGKAIAWMKRENKNSYLSNLAQGGSAYKVDLPKNYIELAEKAAKILTLDYCGVDLLEGPDGEPMISEVNSNAFYEGIEKTTGVNVAAAYIDYLLKKVY
mgnify:CR=1 FL=1